jgi:hypothetical protein
MATPGEGDTAVWPEVEYRSLPKVRLPVRQHLRPRQSRLRRPDNPELKIALAWARYPDGARPSRPAMVSRHRHTRDGGRGGAGLGAGMTTASGLAQGALALASFGLRVHPCAPGQKVPLLKDWPARATLDQAAARAWWQRWPTGNIAIATGGDARLLVIDVEPDACGEASLAALEHEHGATPATVEVVTPSGGRHLYLIVPEGRPMPGNTAGKLGAGIDTRGQGGYVLAPPSVVSSRAYEWSVDCNNQIAVAPSWLLDRLDRGGGDGKATPAAEWLALVTNGVAEGARNHTIARLAGLLFRYLPDPEVAIELIACFNAVKCRPPLAAAELRRTLESIAAAELRKWRGGR